MRVKRIVVLLAVALAALSHQSDGQQARPLAEQLRLAGVVPRGALVYLQVRDLAALMSRWTASPTRAAFYDSASFKRFEQSNIYLKFQDRKTDFEKALGFGVDEARLAELAGGASAVALYDIGKLEVVFVTEVGRDKAIATTLFKNAPQFEERSAAGGAYYVREVSTDGGRIKQQFCFAYSEGKLLVTTTEGLMIRALANARAANATSEDAALGDVLALASAARGFVSRDVTMWLDQAKLNASRHFKSYWLYGNVSDKSDDSLAGIESGLLDLRFAPEGLTEQRWFKVAATQTAAATLTGEQATALLRFAPRDAQLIEIHAATAGVGEAAALALLGKDFDASYTPVEPDESADSSDDDDSSSASRRAERYSRLDQRFDRDVDDAQARGVKANGQAARFAKPSAAGSSRPSTAAKLAPLLAPAANFVTLARSRSETGRPFVRFERGVVIEMKSAIDRAALERLVTEEMRERFVVAGINPQLVWQDDTPAGARFLAQTLIEQGAAIAVTGKYLVLASSREFARDIVTAGAATTATTATPAVPSSRVDGAVAYYGVVRISAAKPVYDKLMAKLDGKTAMPAASGDDEEGQEIKFFSDNLSSFIAATTFREARVRRVPEGGLLTERLVYAW